MATRTFVDFSLAEAERLADLGGIEWDLKSARRFAQLIDHQFRTNWPGHEYGEALTIALIVMYWRPFTDGARYFLGEMEQSWMSAEQLALHRRMRDYRNKHVAHSVNAYELNTVCACYCVERVHEEGFTDITLGGERVVGMSGGEIVQLVVLIDAWLGQVGKLIEAEKKKVLRIVRAMPMDEVLAFGQRPLSSPHTVEVGKARKTKPRTRMP